MSKELELEVSVAEQVVRVKSDDQVIWQAPVSTSCYGLGSEENSFRTPLGQHIVAEKIGEAAPLGMVFKGRVPTGEVWSSDLPSSKEDLVLTRILWLAGEEPDNANSKPRYIYFHGTNHPELIGTPASHGCVRLRNEDMVRLFDYAEVGTKVMIHA